jgi:hypothetical protein
MVQCKAVVEHGRIQLIIRKNEKGYKEFVKVLDSIEKNGYQSWYGDVTDVDGTEMSGLIITSQIRKEKQK